MNEISIYASVSVTILGVAYPILLQVISRLDEKYDSDHIVELFEKEGVNRLFKVSLILSLVSIFLWTLDRPPLFLNDYFVIENSAAILVIVTTVTLIFTFFCFVDKVMTYYTPKKLVYYFEKEHERHHEDLVFFNALSDIFLVSIRKRWIKISSILSSFFCSEFDKVRKKHTDSPIKYPYDFYLLVYHAVQELAILKERRNLTLEKSIGGGGWLLGEEGNISSSTYNWMWNNLTLMVQYNHDDMLLFYWENSEQYFSKQLLKWTDDSRSSKQEFVEFQYFLGGFLIFCNKIDCIGRMFLHTNRSNLSVLLPISMNEIFQFFFKIGEPKYENISEIYSFPQLSGVDAVDSIRSSVRSYMAILFLRQYSLKMLFTNDNCMAPPTLPHESRDKKIWIADLDFFEKLIRHHLSDTDMLMSIGLGFITEEWCRKHEKPHPISFLQNLKERIQEK